MSLSARRALYFHSAVAAKLRLSPGPANIHEVRWLRDCFAKIAPLEHFSVLPAGFSQSNPFQPYIHLVFNSAGQPPLLSPYNHPAADPAAVMQIEARASEIAAYVRSVCGLPRFSFIDGDHHFMNGSTQVVLKHSLTSAGARYQDAYQVSPSTIASPFFLLSSSHPVSSIVPHIRHNFQKLHKIEVLSVETGLAGVHSVVGGTPDKFSFTPHQQVNIEDIVDLHSAIDVEETNNNSAY